MDAVANKLEGIDFNVQTPDENVTALHVLPEHRSLQSCWLAEVAVVTL
jgi:hypothetical protein